MSQITLNFLKKVTENVREKYYCEINQTLTNKQIKEVIKKVIFPNNNKDKLKSRADYSLYLLNLHDNLESALKEIQTLLNENGTPTNNEKETIMKPIEALWKYVKVSYDYLKRGKL
jgi:hypothetical protein